jgi:glucokinase
MKAIGIDFGGTTIKSGLVHNGKIVQRGTIIDTQKCPNPDAILDALTAVVHELHGGEPDVGHVGIGLPGIVDSVNGIVHELTNVPGWREVPLRALLQERSGLLVTIENDANAMAYGEWRYGAARNGQHVVCITLGTGVGGALILDGRLYRGAQLGAGEIGHASIDYKGLPGPYGNFGGLEEYVGNQQIADRAVRYYADAGQQKVAADCTPILLDQAARAGDSIAQRVWTEVGTEIGAALASVIWVLNPDTIVIGGGVAKAGNLILDPIRESVRVRTIRVFHENLRIVPAELGNDAGIIGNAVLALESQLKER